MTASAGTGKTRVLADRVLRLLLAGSDPRQLLCLTFTKAAAAEMVARVQKDLGRLAVRPRGGAGAGARGPARPSGDGEPSGPARAPCSREVLDLPAGLPIMTIHGFCQSLLKRFPLEAGVVPHFEVLDPRSAADLLREALAEVLASRRGEIRAALDRLAVLLGETTLAEGLAALREDRLRLGALLAGHGGDVERVIAAVRRGARACRPAAAPSRCARRPAPIPRSIAPASWRRRARSRPARRATCARAPDHRRLAGGRSTRADADLARLRGRVPHRRGASRGKRT